MTVQAGMTIADLNSTLALYGMALPNLGDIEYQTVSGALATATHGTGSRLGVPRHPGRRCRIGDRGRLGAEPLGRR